MYKSLKIEQRHLSHKSKKNAITTREEKSNSNTTPKKKEKRQSVLTVRRSSAVWRLQPLLNEPIIPMIAMETTVQNTQTADEHRTVHMEQPCTRAPMPFQVRWVCLISGCARTFHTVVIPHVCYRKRLYGSWVGGRRGWGGCYQKVQLEFSVIQVRGVIQF